MDRSASTHRAVGRDGDGHSGAAPIAVTSRFDRACHVLAVAIAAALGAIGVSGWVAGQMRVAIYFGAFSMVTVVGLSVRPRVPPSVQLLLAFAMALNGPGWTWKWLDRIFLYDDLAHTVTTAAFAAVGGAIVLDRYWTTLRRNLGLYLAFLITAAITGGVLWEIYEWICDHLVAIPPHTMSLTDTMEDLISDIVGAVWGGAMGVWSVARRKARGER